MSTDLAESPAASTSTLPALEALAIVDNATNGLPSPTEKPESNGEVQDEAEMSQEDLRAELEQIKGEKEHLENQYRALLGKLTTMRNTLGDKLRQDADELDRRASEIASLRQSNADLTYSTETLRSELISANEESSSLSAELHDLRSRTSDSNNESEELLAESRQEVEELRNSLMAWQEEAEREKMLREELETNLDGLARDCEGLRVERDRLQQERDREKSSARNLSQVLEDFQSGKEREIEGLTSDLRGELQSATRMMSEYKQRSIAAEGKLSSIQDASDQTSSMRHEVKEKNLLIGKLRHEAVILNEHLTEALRRLRKDSSDQNVDRRLVTNVLLSFLTTPRADAKRFQMLQLLASVLSWSDDDREKAGLQKASSSSSTSSPKRSTSPTSMRRGHSRTKTAKKEDDLLAENESFSNLWVEYLLKESATSNQTPSTPPVFSPPPGTSERGLFSPPASNVGSYFSTGSPSPGPSTRRPSVSSASVFSTGPSSIAGPNSAAEEKKEGV